MKLNNQLIEQIKQGTHCIEMPDNPSKEDVELLNEILPDDDGFKHEGYNKYYGLNWDSSHNTLNKPTIKLHDFLILDDPKMISVDEVLEWITTNLDETKNDVGERLVSVNKLKQFLTDKTK
jgi:hypothetical protein